MQLRVVQAMPGWDMRKIRAAFDLLPVRRLKPGQCVVALNGAQTIARVFGYGHVFAQLYAPQGQRFSLTLISEQLKAGLFVELDRSAIVQRKRHTARARKAAP